MTQQDVDENANGGDICRLNAFHKLRIPSLFHLSRSPRHAIDPIARSIHLRVGPKSSLFFFPLPPPRPLGLAKVVRLAAGGSIEMRIGVGGFSPAIG